MTEIITIYYSVQNGGDGSAYPEFMESKKLARWDQEHERNEEWGESCDGELRFEVQEGGYIGSSHVTTELSYLLEHYLEEYDEGGWEYLDEFMSDFFPDGIPQLTVVIDDEYYRALLDGKQAIYRWAYDRKLDRAHATEQGREELETKINSLVSLTNLARKEGEGIDETP